MNERSYWVSIICFMIGAPMAAANATADMYPWAIFWAGYSGWALRAHIGVLVFE